MNVEKTELVNLRDKWLKLYTNTAYNKNFNYDLFKNVFIDTFRAVQHLSYQESVEKKYITLLMILNDFQNTRLIRISEEHRAACHLTHEMTKDCFAHIFASGEMPVMVDSKDKTYSYEDVYTLIEIIKNHK